MIYDRLAPYYDQFIDTELHDLYIDLIAKHHIDGTIIDLGCGTGQLAIQLAKNNYFVTATDISTNMLERAMNNAVEAGVHINFFVHNISEPINHTYDVYIMSSDVINYLDNEQQVQTAFKHISDAMSQESIFLFDFIHDKYIERIHNYKEDILLDDNVLQWYVRKTNNPLQIKHTLMFGTEVESHLQTSFPPKTYRRILQEVGIQVIKKARTDERIIFVCKRK